MNKPVDAQRPRNTQVLLQLLQYGVRSDVLGLLVCMDESDAISFTKLACSPELTPGLGFESGYFRSLERRCGDGTEGEVDGGDHRVLA